MKSGNVRKEFMDLQVEAMCESGEYGGMINRHKMVLDLVVKHSNPGDRVLDVGCFDGKVLKALEKLGYKNLFGCDFSKASGKSFSGTSIHFLPYDIEHDRFPFSEKFDVVIYGDVLEHLFSPQTVLFDIRRHLKTNGKIVISVPNAGWFLNGLLLTFWPSKLWLSTAFGPWGHTYQFTLFGLKEMAKKLGYKVLEIDGGKMDNTAFKTGIKKFGYEMFIWFLTPLAKAWPQFFSAHFFGVLESSSASADFGSRLALGV